MGARKKSEDGEDGMPKAKRPNNFWAPFNTWWREHHEQTGNRATVVEMREWYAQNAHAVWPADMMPSVEEMLKIAKGLRTIKQVQAYFRTYRKNLKTRKEGDPSSPEAAKRAQRRHVNRIVGVTADTFLTAMQQAAHQYHLQQQQMQPAMQPGAPNHVALSKDPPDERLPFLEWGFTSEAAAAAAMEALEGNSEDDALSDAEGEGDARCATVDNAAQAAVPNPNAGPGVAIKQEVMDMHADMPSRLPVAAAGPTENGPFAAAGASSIAQALHDSWAQHGQQHAHLLPPAVAHRRIVKAVRTSAGGSTTTTIERASGNSAGGAAILQGVPCRHTRIRTSAGGVWHQEVEQLELGVASASQLPFGLQRAAYPSMSLPCQPEDSSFCSASYNTTETLTGMVWHGRSTAGGSGEGPCTSGAPAVSLGMGAMLGADDGSVHAPPRKQIRCGDRGVVSLGGGDASEPTNRGLRATQNGSLPQAPEGAQLGDGAHNGARRYAQSYGGNPPMPAYSAAGHRHKAPHGSSQALAAVSDGGGSVYAAQLPAPHHPLAPPPYRGASSYGGLSLSPWAQHHPHAGPLPPPHHHTVYPPYPVYSYRHPQLPYSSLPSYGYPHANHAPQSGYPPMPTYHMPVPYHPYGLQTQTYGQYFRGPDGAGAGTCPIVPDGRPPERSSITGQQQLGDQRADLGPSLQLLHGHQQQQQLQHPPGQQQPVLHMQQHPHHPQSQDLHMQQLPHQRPEANRSQQQQLQGLNNEPGHSATPSRPQPLQLVDLPTLPCSLLTGTMDSLSGSDLAGLSGLSALGLTESDAEDEEAASGRHSGLQHATQHAPCPSEAGSQGGQQQRREQHGAPQHGGNHPSSGRSASVKLAVRDVSHSTCLLSAEASSAKQHSHGKGGIGCTAVPATSGPAAPAPRVTGDSPITSAGNCVTDRGCRHLAMLHDRPFADRPEGYGHSGSVTDARPSTGECHGHHPSPACTDMPVHPGHATGRPSYDGSADGDGCGTDGTASLYYKTPKLVAKPLGLLSGDMLQQEGEEMASQTAAPSTIDALHQRQLLLLDGLGAAVSGNAAHGGAVGGVGSEGPKGRNGLAPMTIHVLQEEVMAMAMPHGLGLGLLGDIGGLHSPTGSLSLGLLETPADEGAEELGIWGSCG